jgi:hypothetical protein
MKDLIEKIKADPRYQKNIEFGEPRSGHPEGKIRHHLIDLEENLERLRERGISDEDYWKLKFMIHVHDSFKAEAEEGTPAEHPRNHAMLAREYASQYTNDTDLLNMILYHDENFKLWREYKKNGTYDQKRLLFLLDTIKNWDLFLIFLIIDGCIKGKEYSKLTWFMDEVRKYKIVSVDSTWVLPPEE